MKRDTVKKYFGAEKSTRAETNIESKSRFRYTADKRKKKTQQKITIDRNYLSEQ